MNYICQKHWHISLEMTMRSLLKHLHTEYKTYENYVIILIVLKSSKLRTTCYPVSLWVPEVPSRIPLCFILIRSLVQVPDTPIKRNWTIIFSKTHPRYRQDAEYYFSSRHSDEDTQSYISLLYMSRLMVSFP